METIDTQRSKTVTEAELDEIARVLHIMGCVKDCNGNHAGWHENAVIVLEILGMTPEVAIRKRGEP